MNAADLLIWGLVVHLVCDWLLQNEWMALNKMKRRPTPEAHTDWGYPKWWNRHPAAYVHSGIHLLGMLLVFPAWAAVVIATTHFLIDLRWPVEKWSKLIGQTQPNPSTNPAEGFDIGWDVRIWNDQVWHILVLAIVALVVA